MLKKIIISMVFFLLSYVAVQAQIEVPTRIGGTLTVNGKLFTAADMEGYIIKVSRQDNTIYDPPAETDELNEFDVYIINIPISEHGAEDGAAKTGETAVIHIYKNNEELEIESPAQGKIVVGKSGDLTEYNLVVKMEASALNADAGDDQEVKSGDLVTLDGSGSSGQAAFEWEQIQGDVIAELSDASAAKPTFTAPKISISDPVTLIFKLTVKKDSESKSDTVKIIVNPSSQDQTTAEAGDLRTAFPGETVTLDASESKGREEPVTYAWEQVGGTLVALSDPVSVNPSFTAPEYNPDADMVLVFKLTVTDNSGQTASDTVSITISQASQNRPPVANAGSDQTARPGQQVQLDALNSTDPDNGQGNGINSYTWTQAGNTTRVNLSDYHSPRPVFTAPDVGADGQALIFELIVSDKAGLEDTDSVTINIVSENQPPTAKAGPDQSVNAGDLVSLDASASYDSDPGDTINFKWEQISGIPVVLSSYLTSKPVFTAPVPDNGGSSIGFELVVEDRAGLRHTDKVYINIITDTPAPVSNAGPDQTVRSGEIVRLDGSGSTDPLTNILLWAQTAGGTPVILSDAKALRPEFTAPAVGVDGEELVFELTVVDKNGLQNTDEVVINILFTGTNPVADAGDEKTFDEGSTGILDGSDSSSPFGIVDYNWRQLSGPTVKISNPNAEKSTFFIPGVSSNNVQLVFELTIRDSSGLSDTDTVTFYIYDFGEGPGEDDSSCFINSAFSF